MIHRLDHIGIKIQDMERSIQFYSEVLGMQLTRRAQLSADVEVAFLAFPGHETIQIELIADGSGELADRSRIDHIALLVSDIESEAERLEQAGAKLIDPAPRVLPGGKKVLFLQGPDGEVLQFVQP